MGSSSDGSIIVGNTHDGFLYEVDTGRWRCAGLERAFRWTSQTVGPGHADYNASKAELILLTKASAIELTYLGVRANAG